MPRSLEIEKEEDEEEEDVVIAEGEGERLLAVDACPLVGAGDALVFGELKLDEDDEPKAPLPLTIPAPPSLPLSDDVSIASSLLTHRNFFCLYARCACV